MGAHRLFIEGSPGPTGPAPDTPGTTMVSRVMRGLFPLLNEQHNFETVTQGRWRVASVP